MQDSYLKPMFSWLQEILDQCISYISYKVFPNKLGTSFKYLRACTLD